MVTGQCGKSVEALCICVSVAFFITLDSDVFCLSCWTLQFTKYFNITNGNNRRREEEGKKGEWDRLKEERKKNYVWLRLSMRSTANGQFECFSIMT